MLKSNYKDEIKDGKKMWFGSISMCTIIFSDNLLIKKISLKVQRK